MLNNICKFFFIFFFIFLTKTTTASENQLFDYYKTIRCLVCDGQSIQESDTEFALNLKANGAAKDIKSITTKKEL
jgi:cytochrome c-type biogenesis protein CcmH